MLLNNALAIRTEDLIISGFCHSELSYLVHSITFVGVLLVCELFVSLEPRLKTRRVWVPDYVFICNTVCEKV